MIKEKYHIIIYFHLIPKTHEVNNTKLFVIPIDIIIKQTATIINRMHVHAYILITYTCALILYENLL